MAESFETLGNILPDWSNEKIEASLAEAVDQKMHFLCAEKGQRNLDQKFVSLLTGVNVIVNVFLCY